MNDVSHPLQHSTLLKSRYQCKYCGKHFVRESAYLEHQCKEMKRHHEMQTPLGQAALDYYIKWMRNNGKLVKRPEAFTSSKFYMMFMRFAKFVKDVKLPQVETYMWMMKQKDLPPSLWTNDEVYNSYLEFLDNQLTPLQLTTISTETLLNKAEQFQIDVSEIFDHITIGEILHMLRTRQLSPWLLLESKKFKQLVKEKTTDEQKILLETFIRPDHWIDKRLKHKKELQLIKQIVSELNI